MKARRIGFIDFSGAFKRHEYTHSRNRAAPGEYKANMIDSRNG